MKKASISLQTSWLVDLFFVTIIILLFIGINLKIKDPAVFILKAEARDYAFTKDAASISTQKLNYIYNENKEVILDEKDCEIIVKSKEKEILPERYYCARKYSDLKAMQEDNKIIMKNE